MDAADLIFVVSVAATPVSSIGCYDECKNELNWCDGNVLKTCSSMASSELGSHDHVSSSDCKAKGAVCRRSMSGSSAACILPKVSCSVDDVSVCSDSTLLRCFDGFARLDVGKQIDDAEECEHRCEFVERLGKSYCLHPDPSCETEGEIRCLEIRPGSSLPDFEACVAPGWRANGECGLGYCGDPLNQSDPCLYITLDDAGVYDR